MLRIGWIRLNKNTTEIKEPPRDCSPGWLKCPNNYRLTIKTLQFMDFTSTEPVEYPRQGRSQKLKFIMRFSFVYVVLSLTVIGFSTAHTTYSQSAEQRMTTIGMENESLRALITKIKEQTGVNFYFPGKVDEYKNLNLPKADRTVKEVLDLMLKGTALSYRANENTIFIYVEEGKEEKEPEQKEETNEKTETSPTISTPAFTVTGTVTDGATQTSLAGVNIIVKGTTRGTTTDANGKFAIDAENNEVLVFSFIGFKTFETVVGGRTVIDVVMEADSKVLREVVVNAGYYNVKDREQTGNIAKIDAKDIQKQPVQNALSALQGRVPGLEITQSTGVPGSNFKVRIRGTNSIANGNDPLFIIDGVPFTSTSMADAATSGPILGQGTSPLNGINPADIESIEVLKDADATAIYGSRGSNGVILITTKKGQAGKTRIDFNFYTGGGNVTRKMDLLNTQQYLEMRHQAFKNDNEIPTIANARDLLEWDTTRHTDWQEKLIGGTARTTDAQLSISGGDKSTQFSVGGGYHKEGTVFPGYGSDQRFSLRSSITNASFNQKLRTTVSLNYVVNNTDFINRDLTSRALLLPPNAPALYDDKGELSWENWTSTYENPLASLKRNYEATTNNLRGDGVISYSILPNLGIRSNFGYTSVVRKAITTIPISSQFPDPGAVNASQFWESNFKNWIIEPQVNWKPKLGESKFDVLVGTSFLDQTEQGLAQSGQGFSSEALMKNLSSAPAVTQGNNFYSQYRYQAIFGRINYSFKNKYILNVTGRRDGSSRFGPGRQFATFAATGAAWIFSEETFLKNAIPIFSFGKLRVSYGTSGNDQIGNYNYLDTYSSSLGQYLGVIGLQPDRLSNPDFAWELNKKFETGLELGFLNDKIVGKISYFKNRTSSQLVGFPLPATTGFSSIQGNFPATVQNTGVEIELNTRNIEASDFSWSTSLNITIPRNKLVRFPNLEDFPAYANLYKVGEPLSIRKLNNNTGVDPVTGVYTFEDVNGDSSINFLDAQQIKFEGQTFYGGLNNTVRYKGFQLDIFLQFVKQTRTNYTWSFGAPGIMGNVPDFVMERWQSEGDNASIQRFGQSGDVVTAYDNLLYSQPSITDASFIRLKNVALSYSFPSTWVQKMNAENVRVFIQAQNLFTITDYKGLDPETGSSALPPLRVITGGINLTF
jgi:TonB-linked SusC/RagA family outer membrane protein